jgi:hypothetical protein
VSLRQPLPLVAFRLNGSPGLLALPWDSRSGLNRLFAAFPEAMGVWTFGIFLRRSTPDRGRLGSRLLRLLDPRDARS